MSTSIAPTPTPHPVHAELERRGLSQRKVARYLGIANPNLNTAIRGLRPVPAHVREGLSQLLGMEPCELFNDVPHHCTHCGHEVYP